MPLRSNFDVGEMSFAVGFDNATETACIDFILELPKGVAVEVLACSKLDDLFWHL